MKLCCEDEVSFQLACTFETFAEFAVMALACAVVIPTLAVLATMADAWSDVIVVGLFWIKLSAEVSVSSQSAFTLLTLAVFATIAEACEDVMVVGLLSI